MNPGRTIFPTAAYFLAAIFFISSCGSANISVMSFNVRQSHVREDSGNSWNERKNACVKMVRDNCPDLLGLQEAWYKDQYGYLLENLCDLYDGIAVGRENGKDKGETTGILYRKDAFSLLDSGTFWLSDTPEIPSASFDEKYERPVTWALFSCKNGVKFFYLNTHLGLTQISRTKGVELILGFLGMKNDENLPVILSGDFNMSTEDSAYRMLSDAMSDARFSALKNSGDSIPTYNAWGNKDKESIIDYVMVSDKIICLSYDVVQTPYDGHELISDHYPVLVELKIKK